MAKIMLTDEEKNQLIDALKKRNRACVGTYAQAVSERMFQE